MAYKFRLEAVLRFRQNLEEVAQQKLARQLAELEARQGSLASLRQQREDMIAELEEEKRLPIAAPFFALRVEGIFRKEQEIETGLAQVDEAKAAVTLAREELAERMRDRKVMEKVRERDHQDFLQSRLKNELNEADEQVMLREAKKAKLFSYASH